MTVLFGHPVGNPNSHHAALAHFESGWLEAFCVPWMPSPVEMGLVGRLPGLHAEAARLSRRCFAPLAGAPRIGGRAGEWWRMARRLLPVGQYADDRLSYEANDWLMSTMRRACGRSSITAVHAYEDCSLWAFEEAKRLGKACIYDMPIGYYPAWEHTQAQLARRFADWLPAGGVNGSRYVRRDQKKREMELADLVLVPSSFVGRTIAAHMDKRVHSCPYGVDAAFWHPDEGMERDGTLRFIYAGSCSLRKGTPVLLQAWEAAQLKDAQLELVGSWQLADDCRTRLPKSVRVSHAVSASELRSRYQAADVFVFPSFFEGFGLVILEALACGLPVIATDATAGPDLLDESTGRTLPAGDVDALVESLRWFDTHRERLADMKQAARALAMRSGWPEYRRNVAAAVEPFAR